jgi:hypothetical protein
MNRDAWPCPCHELLETRNNALNLPKAFSKLAPRLEEYLFIICPPFIEHKDGHRVFQVKVRS